MSFTALEVQEKISDFVNDEDYNGYSNFYEWIKSEGIDWRTGEPTRVEVPNLGTVAYVDDFGGEGSGDDYWVVFSVRDQLFRVNGYYASYDGGELDGDVQEVVAKEVKAVEYEVKNS